MFLGLTLGHLPLFVKQRAPSLHSKRRSAPVSGGLITDERTAESVSFRQVCVAAFRQDRWDGGSPCRGPDHRRTGQRGRSRHWDCPYCGNIVREATLMQSRSCACASRVQAYSGAQSCVRQFAETLALSSRCQVQSLVRRSVLARSHLMRSPLDCLWDFSPRCSSLSASSQMDRNWGRCHRISRHDATYVGRWVSGMRRFVHHNAQHGDDFASASNWWLAIETTVVPSQAVQPGGRASLPRRSERRAEPGPEMARCHPAWRCSARAARRSLADR